MATGAVIGTETRSRAATAAPNHSMLAQSFRIERRVEPVRAWVATASAERMVARARRFQAATMRMTAAARRVLVEIAENSNGWKREPARGRRDVRHACRPQTVAPGLRNRMHRRVGHLGARLDEV
jgi:hypothetical protein